ncbi:MAG TPA: hypothetical protein VH878_08600 [Thermodesulfobacteriota bacterium]
MYIVLIILIVNPVTASTLIASSSEISTKESEKVKMENAKRFYFDYYKDSTNLDRSINTLQEIIEKDPNNLEAMILLSRVWLTFGYVKATIDEEKIGAFTNGMEVAKKAIQVSPDNPDAHFFYVANLGSWGATHGILRSLFLLSEIRKELELILELDPNHVYGLGMTGILYYTIPSFIGGDLTISEIYLKRAMRLDPNLTILKIYLAKTLIKQGKYDEATVMLKDVMEENNPTDHADWHINKGTAKQMLTTIEKKTQSKPSPSESIRLSTD